VKYKGRKKPYTAVGIIRVPCTRCGESSMFQWQVCANKNRYSGVCYKCDIMLNRKTLNFFGFDNVNELMDKYKVRKEVIR